MTTVHLIYAPDNRDLADRISADLGRAGIIFQHHTLQADDLPGHLSARIAALQEPVVWLLTDNFLKNPLCMSGILKAYQQLSARGLLMTVVADGRELQPDGSYRPVTTQFDRVGYAIKYMNYWQDIFLKSTDRLREVPLEQREAYDREMEVYRLIANEIGELFTALREAGYLRWEEFKAEDFAAFFRRFGWTEQYHAYRKLAALDAEAPPPQPAAPSAPKKPVAQAPIFTRGLTPQPVEEPAEVPPSSTVSGQEPSEEDIRQSVRDAWKWVDSGYPERGLEQLRRLAEEHPQHAIVQAEYHRARTTLEPTPPPPQPSAPSNGYAPTEADAYNAMGDNALSKGDFLLAKYCWDRVSELDPAYPGVYRKLADLTIEHFLDEYRESALNYVEQALAAEPEDAELHYHYAVLARDRLQEPELARQLFGKAVALQPEYADGWLALAYLVAEAGDAKQAYDLYQQACALNPQLRTAERDALFPLPAIGAPHPAFDTEQEQWRPQEEPSSVRVLTVLITGATSGIGRATAELFARHGHRLILVGRRAERLAEVRERFAEVYPKAAVLTLPFDVRDAAAVANHLGNLPEEWEEIDVLINNAGLAKGLAPIHEGRLDHWDTMIDTNIKGLLYVTRAVAPGMVRRRRGHIINVGSSAGKEVYPNGNVYCATKFAVEALTRGMRLDLHPYGIRVSQVSPGHTEDTEFALTRFDGNAERARIYEDFQPLKAADVAEAIYFIATRPAHVNVQDIWLYSTQQASALIIDRSGRPEQR